MSSIRFFLGGLVLLSFIAPQMSFADGIDCNSIPKISVRPDQLDTSIEDGYGFMNKLRIKIGTLQIIKDQEHFNLRGSIDGKAINCDFNQYNFNTSISALTAIQKSIEFKREYAMHTGQQVVFNFELAVQRQQSKWSISPTHIVSDDAICDAFTVSEP